MIFLIIMTILSMTLIIICSQVALNAVLTFIIKNYHQVTLPGSLDQQDSIRPLPLTNNVAKLPNGDFVCYQNLHLFLHCFQEIWCSL